MFGLIFAGVGGGMMIAAIRAPPAIDEADPRYIDTPWLANDDWLVWFVSQHVE